MDLFALEELVIGHSILELNPVTVRSAMAEGEPNYFGDIDRAFLYLTVGETDGPGPPGGGAGA